MQGVLSGWFDQTDLTAMRVVFNFPPLLAANARPPMVLDVGDGSPTIQTDATGKATHTYSAPALITASLTDVDGTDCGKLRFQVPRTGHGPFTLGPGYSYPP